MRGARAIGDVVLQCAGWNPGQRLPNHAGRWRALAVLTLQGYQSDQTHLGSNLPRAPAGPTLVAALADALYAALREDGWIPSRSPLLEHTPRFVRPHGFTPTTRRTASPADADGSLALEPSQLASSRRGRLSCSTMLNYMSRFAVLRSSSWELVGGIAGGPGPAYLTLVRGHRGMCSIRFGVGADRGVVDAACCRAVDRVDRSGPEVRGYPRPGWC